MGGTIITKRTPVLISNSGDFISDVIWLSFQKDRKPFLIVETFCFSQSRFHLFHTGVFGDCVRVLFSMTGIVLFFFSIEHIFSPCKHIPFSSTRAKILFRLYPVYSLFVIAMLSRHPFFYSGTLRASIIGHFYSPQELFPSKLVNFPEKRPTF